MPERDYLVRADGYWVRDTRGRLVSFTAKGAHRWAARHRPNAYTVAFLHRPGRTPEPGFATQPREPGCTCAISPNTGKRHYDDQCPVHQPSEPEPT